MHGYKTVRDIDDFHPTISVVTLNMNGLNTPVKRENFRMDLKSNTELYARNSL